MTADTDPVTLVTGAAGGIGAATARAFADEGWTVYATDVETPLPTELQECCRCRELDVTSETQCRAVVDDVVAATGRLDCLEDVGVDAGRALFDVLAHGPHRLSRLALPALRERGGRIVNVSSVLARRAYPGLGAYSGGKAALSAMTDALRMELADGPVEVALVEPAWVATGFADGARDRLPADRTPEYDAVYEGLEDGWVLESGPMASPPERVAETIVAAATDPDPRARYPVGRFARFTRWVEWLPPRVADPCRRGFARLTAALNGWL